MKLLRTKMMTRYLFRFTFRIIVFLAVLFFYISDKNHFWDVMTKPVFFGISPIIALWFLFMLIMIQHLFPNELRSMALRKENEKYYNENHDYSELELYKFVQTQNIRAWQVMLIWLSFNALFGILYLFHVLDATDLIMLTVFFFLCDYICILVFCPFQTYIMKNKCCVNCRIYDWGHFMMFTPMLFIPNFFSWSLFFTSLIVLISWEIRYSKHPERFWSGANKTLKCSNCQDKTCQIKRKFSGKSLHNANS